MVYPLCYAANLLLLDYYHRPIVAYKKGFPISLVTSLYLPFLVSFYLHHCVRIYSATKLFKAVYV